MPTGEDAHGSDYFTPVFLLPQLCNSTGIVDELTSKGVTVTFLHENLIFAKDTTDPRADLMLGILGSFAEFERAIIRERQAEGIALAKKAGKYKGRKPALTPDQVAEIKRRTLAGESKAALAREFGVTRPTVYRALKNA
ncbi:recombinase family protein [Corynebacterium aurimucosum]|nr:recombinase family protein [Corynebacterium aurimucosum]